MCLGVWWVLCVVCLLFVARRLECVDCLRFVVVRCMRCVVSRVLCGLPISYCVLHAMFYVQFVTSCLFCVMCCRLPVVYCSLFAVCYLMAVRCNF